MSILSINPHNQEILRSFPEYNTEQVITIINKTQIDQKEWAGIQIRDRVNHVKKLAELIRSSKDFHAKTITREMGKPIIEANAEIEKCALLCDYYVETAIEVLKEKTISSSSGNCLIRHEPLGILLSIMPWNFPYWQVFRAAIPALLAGNGVILKHASNTSVCSLAIEAAFQGANFPQNIFRSVLVSGKNSNTLIAHPDISAITFTGSNDAGEKIASSAGALIKKTVLELGGSDPSIVTSNADILNAVSCCVKSRMLNAGQSCIAAKRILVDQTIAELFVKEATREISQIQVGDPMDQSTQMGPLATPEILNDIERQVNQSIEMGATCILGGKKSDIGNCYFEPTLLTNITPEMPVWKEETFGPVMCVTTYQTTEEAITLANNTQWGLGASVYSKNKNEALDIAKKIQTGTCAINDFVKSDPKVPFGGVRKSGYGRELSQEGLLEFTNTKAYHIS